MNTSTLLAVPNVSEGRDVATIEAIGAAFAGASPGGGAVRLLDVHRDGDHNRSVFTLAGPPGELADALLRGFAVAVERIDVVSRAARGAEAAGQHPHVGAVDVAPIVYLNRVDAGAACAEALVVGDRIGTELGVPVLLYGELSAEPPATQRTRAQLRRGGPAALALRLQAPADDPDALAADFGPARLHPGAGATLVAARPPLVAFNVMLATPATVADARAVAASIREGGSRGLPGVRAIGVQLGGGVAQVSMNVESPSHVPLAAVVAAIQAHAPVAGAELVGLAPTAAMTGFPPEVPIRGFDPARQLIENALGS